MKKAFTLVEVLIGVFVLGLAIIGIAAVFATTTKRVVENYDEIQGRSIRRSADAYYPFVYREQELQAGWNIEYNSDLSNEYKIAYLTYKLENSPNIVVVVAFKGNAEAYISDANSYRNDNKDVLVSWYGFHHVVENNSVAMQNFELEQQFVVLPYQKMQVLDVHRYDMYP
jgi:hypothetical protein